MALGAGGGPAWQGARGCSPEVWVVTDITLRFWVPVPHRAN